MEGSGVRIRIRANKLGIRMRIQEAQKHSDYADPDPDADTDPEHWYFHPFFIENRDTYMYCCVLRVSIYHLRVVNFRGELQLAALKLSGIVDFPLYKI
jgi:hypothetical protein